MLATNDRALCRCGIRIPSAPNRCPAFDKDKCLETMFGDVGHARTNAAMLLMMIEQPQAALAQNPLLAVVVFCQRYFIKPILLLSVIATCGNKSSFVFGSPSCPDENREYFSPTFS